MTNFEHFALVTIFIVVCIEVIFSFIKGFIRGWKYFDEI